MGQAYWDARARKYGRFGVGYFDPANYEYEEHLRWDAFQRICKVKPGMRVLDIGCGAGRWSVKLAERGCRVTGTDLSPVFIEMAQPHPLVDYRVGAVQDLDLPSAHFDLVLSVTVLQHIVDDSDLDRALRKLHEALKPRGMAAVIEYSPLKPVALAPSVDYMKSRTRDDWVRLLESAGFRLVRETGVRFIGQGRLRGKIDWLTLPVDRILGRVPWLGLKSDLHAFLFQRP
jgi:2-polyprenyl-3-methyl-5-hydroxy-6-metoxy-1,4-benzoquinol methylase